MMRLTAKRRRQQKLIRVLRDFRIIYGSVRRHYKEVEQLCGVSGSQLWMLREIERMPGIGVSELARELAIHQSTCSQLVEKLVRSGHLTKKRSDEDQRRVGLQVTRRGSKTLSDAPGPTQGLLPEAVGELSPTALDSLHRSLRAVISKLDITVQEAADKPLADL